MPASLSDKVSGMQWIEAVQTMSYSASAVLSAGAVTLTSAAAFIRAIIALRASAKRKKSSTISADGDGHFRHHQPDWAEPRLFAWLGAHGA
jgi:hypothetical protein